MTEKVLAVFHQVTWRTRSRTSVTRVYVEMPDGSCRLVAARGEIADDGTAYLELEKTEDGVALP